MRAASLAALAMLAVAALPLAADDAPAGRIVYTRKVEDKKYLVHEMKPDGTGDRVMPGQTMSVNVLPVLSPDGKKLAYMAGMSTNFEDFKLIIQNVDGSGQKTINGDAKMTGTPAWSPDGKHLAFVTGEDVPSLYVADAEGENMRRLSPEGSGGAFPFWFPDSKSLGYTRIMRKGEKMDLIKVNVDGSGEETLAPGDGILAATAGGLSPDGKRLVVMSIAFQAMTGSFKVLDLENKGESFLDQYKAAQTSGPMDLFIGACWGPDSKQMLLALPTDKGVGIFHIAADGQKRTRLTPEGVDCLMPFWGK